MFLWLAKYLVMLRPAETFLSQSVQPRCCSENSPYFSMVSVEPAEAPALGADSAADIVLARQDGTSGVAPIRQIKSTKRDGLIVRSIVVEAPQRIDAMQFRLNEVHLGLEPDRMLTVTAVPEDGLLRSAMSGRDLRVGEVVAAADLAILLFSPPKESLGTETLLELRAIGRGGDAIVVRVTLAMTDSVSRSALRVGQRHAGGVDVDPLTFGLMTALAASMVAAPAAAVPSHAPDAGVTVDRLDGEMHADLSPKSDDPADPSQSDEPSVTGSVPREGNGQRSPDAPRRLMGSSTPPDIWYSGETPLDAWTPPRFDQGTVPPRAPDIGFRDDSVAGFGSFDSIGSAFMTPASFRPTGGSAVSPTVGTTPPVVPSHDEPPSVPASTTGPVAANDGGYLVVGGKRTIQAATVLSNDTVSPGQHLSISSVFDAQHGTVTYDASSQAITFIAAAGYRGNASFSYTIKDDEGRNAQATVSLFVVPDETLFDVAAVPGTERANDANPVELGVRFVSAADGVITGLRFYKGADNVGQHTASLWDASGNLLATTTFDAETSSGWQQVWFASPVVIQAGVSYVASYHTSGFYSIDAGYFVSPVTNGDLTALGSVYAYGAGGIFPTSTFNASNYWIDVVYNRPPAAPDAQDDVIGAILGGRTASFTSSLLLANDQNPDCVPLAISGAGNAQNGTVSYDPLTQTVSFTPTQGYSGTAGFSYTVTNSLGASATADVTLWVDGVQPATFYGASTPPSLVVANDSQSVELGFKFESTTDGRIVGLRFYKGIDNIGTHVGNLWSATGDLLASATFINETASGWQEVMFSTPVSLTAGTTYVASYHSNGNYSADAGYFNDAHTNGVLIAPASTTGSGNGLYAYGSSSFFPTSSFNATSYGVDVLFKANLTG